MLGALAGAFGHLSLLGGIVAPPDLSSPPGVRFGDGGSLLERLPSSAEHRGEAFGVLSREPPHAFCVTCCAAGRVRVGELRPLALERSAVALVVGQPALKSGVRLLAQITPERGGAVVVLCRLLITLSSLPMVL